jgi:hypothetical protein
MSGPLTSHAIANRKVRPVSPRIWFLVGSPNER